MQWVIKNPAPHGRHVQQWGDFHFGEGIAKDLKRLGQQVEIDFFGRWEGRVSEADVVLVLRGRYQADVATFPARVRAMWMISHPENVSLEECSAYDLIFVASQSHARWLQARLGRPVEPLLQCVDGERFYDAESVDADRQGFVFVGNTRQSVRLPVIWALEAGLPLAIWGEGWKEFAPRESIVDTYLDNAQLPILYRQSRATFCEHHGDMRRLGFINNRIFDALACGLPVISDEVAGLEQEFSDGVLVFRDKPQFQHCLERLLLDYPSLKLAASLQAAEIQKKHTFANRAQHLVDAASKLLDSE